MRSFTIRLQASFIVVAAGVLLCGAGSLHAGTLTLIDMFRNITYNQISGAAPTTPSNYFLNLEATEANPGDFTSVSVTYPGPGSPQSLPMVTPTEFGIGPSFATKAAMDAAYPVGTYTYTALGAMPQTASLNYTMDAFTADIPALTAATFTALQGMNPNLPFTFNFNSFTPNAGAGFGETFLTVFGSSFGASGSNTTTSFTMPAGTLLPGTTYQYELDFSDRINGTSGNVPTLIGFDVRTDGSFTTAAAVPEPSTTLPLATAFLGAGLWYARRKFAISVTK